MSNLTIPEEAIDAAWEQARADSDGYPYPERDEIARILEAAAPYLLAEVQWGVRDKDSNAIAGHPSKESAAAAAAEHPEWYEVVSRPWPNPNPPWTANP